LGRELPIPRAHHYNAVLGSHTLGRMNVERVSKVEPLQHPIASCEFMDRAIGQRGYGNRLRAYLLHWGELRVEQLATVIVACPTNAVACMKLDLLERVHRYGVSLQVAR